MDCTPGSRRYHKVPMPCDLFESRAILQAGVKFTSGVPRGEALKQVAFLLENLGSSRQQAKALAESLVLRLLALQVLSVLHFSDVPSRPSFAHRFIIHCVCGGLI